MADIKDILALKGYGTIEVHNALNGKLIYTEDYTNVVTNYVRSNVISSLQGTPLNWSITHIGIGSGANGAHPSDTSLQTQIFRAGYTQIVNYTAYQVGFRLFVSASQYNGQTFREIGLFDAATAGNMFARSTSFTPISKNANITVTFTHKISI